MVEQLHIGGVDEDDQRCLRCGSSGLDTGWECNECGYDNMPHYAEKKGVIDQRDAAPGVGNG